VIPQNLLIPLYFCFSAKMTGSNSSIRGDRHGEEEPPVARAELC